MKLFILNIFLLPVIMFTCVRKITGQTENRPFIFGVKTNYGFIIPHSENIKSISDANPWSVELDFSLLNTRDEAYQLCFCYPKVGFTLSYINFNNPDIIGHGYTFLPFIEPVFGDQKKVRFSLRGSAGFIFLDQPYHETNNPQNFFYSTHLSFILAMNFRLNYFINDHISINASANYNHTSNGGLKEPNKGINFPTASVGLDYNFRPAEFKTKEKVTLNDLYPNRNRIYIAPFYTAKNTVGDKKRYPIYGLYLTYSYIIARISAINANIDLVVDHLVKNRIDSDSTGNSGTDHKTAGLMLGHDLLMGKFIFSVDIGIYLYKKHETKDNYYQRYGIKYLLNDHFFIGANLKAHRHVADFLDFRIGYKF